jgi:hypothetical protein
MHGFKVVLQGDSDRDIQGLEAGFDVMADSDLKTMTPELYHLAMDSVLVPVRKGGSAVSR